MKKREKMNTQPNTYLNQQRDLEHDHMTPLVLFSLFFLFCRIFIQVLSLVTNYRCVGWEVYEACIEGRAEGTTHRSYKLHARLQHIAIAICRRSDVLMNECDRLRLRVVLFAQLTQFAVGDRWKPSDSDPREPICQNGLRLSITGVRQCQCFFYTIYIHVA